MHITPGLPPADGSMWWILWEVCKNESMVTFCQHPHSVYLACFTPSDLCCNGMMFNDSVSTVLIQWLGAFRFTYTTPMGLICGSQFSEDANTGFLQGFYCSIRPVSHRKPTAFWPRRQGRQCYLKILSRKSEHNNKTWSVIFLM